MRRAVRLEFKFVRFLNDVQDIPRAFAPRLTVDDRSPNFLAWRYAHSSGTFTFEISGDVFPPRSYSVAFPGLSKLDVRKALRDFAKDSLYAYLSDLLQIKLEYGTLTGVRPTRIYYELAKKSEHPECDLVEKYHVSKEKADLIALCAKTQSGHLNSDPKKVCLYANVPFCPSRCAYCSFISAEYSRVAKSIGLYLECMKREISTLFEIVEARGFSVLATYVGGGTPTSLPPDSLYDLLSPFASLRSEFTVEAGRPDSVAPEIVEALKALNVDRTCVNPQTFSDATLERIGRRHSVSDFYRAFGLMRAAGFAVNSDLICGLPGEGPEEFASGLSRLVALRPENITLHALSFKRGSEYACAGREKEMTGAASAAMSGAHRFLADRGYLPYYMYRQKNTADNLENAGYCVEGAQCAYNMNMMEETSSILAAGAGSVSKKIEPSGAGFRIERLSSPKGIREYCERIDEICAKKLKFFGLGG